MTQGQSLVALSLFNPFGTARINVLLAYFGGAKALWAAPRQELLRTGLGEKKVIEFEKHRSNFNPVTFFEKLKQAKVETVTFKDISYPKNLKGLQGAPVALYVKGSLEVLSSPSVAIVGSRNMTSYGAMVTAKISSELAAKKVTIVSGLARGVDTQAHKGALSVGGRTVAVLGCGLDRVYPPQNFQLALDIVEKGGALVSEYPLGYSIAASNFAARNRIISGLSKAIVVVEGAAKSGTLLTASAAAEQGRSVFAVPGPISSPLSAAPHFLLENGARIFTSIDEIMEELSD